MGRSIIVSSIAVTALALAACAPKETAKTAAADGASASAAASNASAAAGPNVVTVMASDFAFDAPAQIPAGVTTFRLMNHGKELHHVQLVKLEQGKTFADLMNGMKAMKPTDPPPPWMTEIGGPNPPAPGEEANATLSLEPGNYAMLCFVDTPDHVPHVAKGMARALTVTPSTGPAAAEPTADVNLKLADYTFTFDKPLTAGKHTIRVENTAAQAHEIFLVQLAPGKSLKDLMDWAQTYKGAPPGKPMGGVSGIKGGTHATISVDLPAGDYALLCFIPDAKDGQPHVAHGMSQQIKVS